jgi:putative membrane protein
VAWVWPLLIVIGLGLVGYVAVRLVRDDAQGSPTSDRARRILDDRFARGEIDEQQYRRRREGSR